MSSGSAQVNWYENDLMMVVADATDELVSKIAFQIEAEAKANVQANGQIDTGFMGNAIYSITPLANRRDQAWASGEYESRKTGQTAERVLAPQPDVEDHDAAVHAAAEYTIYQENRRGFLYPAAEKVAGQVSGLIREVGRAHFG